MSPAAASWVRAAWMALALVALLDLYFAYEEDEPILYAAGLLFAALAYFARAGSLVALGAALGVLALDTLITLDEVGANWYWGVRLFVIVLVLSAFLAVRAERRTRAPDANR